jgi:hypothetical protein
MNHKEHEEHEVILRLFLGYYRPPVVFFVFFVSFVVQNRRPLRLCAFA